MEAPFWETCAIYVVRSGSHAYGTNVATSDIDTRGVCIPPSEYLIGLLNFEQHEDKENDTTIYGLHKFVNLALNCNPNIIEMLHVRECDVLHITGAGRTLVENRSLFVSRRAFKTFGGYAFAQLKKLQSSKPHHGTHSPLVERFGYDTKNAMHLIRLLRTGCEVLETGEVHTYRPDRGDLLSIRNGEWTLDAVLAEADRLDTRLKRAYEQCNIPLEPPFSIVNELVMELTRKGLEGRL